MAEKVDMLKESVIFKKQSFKVACIFLPSRDQTKYIKVIDPH